MCHQKMKRRANRLRIARNVGWLAEFPSDIWGVIIGHLPTDKEMPNLGLVLRLMGTSKGMYSVFKQHVLTLFAKVLAYNMSPTNSTKKSDYMYICIYRFFTAAKKEIDLNAYLTQCVTNPSYGTVEHLTNGLSLLHLAVCECRYLDPECNTFREPYFRTPLAKPTRYGHLRNLYYFRPSAQKIVTVIRMNKEVSTIDHGGASSLQLTYYDACRLLEKKGDKTQLTELRRLGTMDTRSFVLRSMIVDVMNEEGGVPIKTHPPNHLVEFEDLIVTIEGKQHYIYSEEAEPFVRNCFYSPLCVDEATKAFVFNSCHARNWAIVTESDRFKVFK